MTEDLNTKCGFPIDRTMRCTRPAGHPGDCTMFPEIKKAFGVGFKTGEELIQGEFPFSEPEQLDLFDPVDKPSHYNQGEIECLDAMEIMLGAEGMRTYATGNAFKYLWRHRYKGQPEEDLKKALFYLRLAVGEDPRG